MAMVTEHLPTKSMIIGSCFFCGAAMLASYCTTCPSLYIGLGQREAQVNHELLFDQAYKRSLFFFFSFYCTTWVLMPCSWSSIQHSVAPAARILAGAICIYGMCGEDHGQHAEKDATVATVIWDNGPLQGPLL